MLMLPLLCFAPMVMALVSWLLGRRSAPARTLAVTATCALALAGCLSLWNREVSFDWDGFCALGLHLRADGFRSLYASIAAFMWLLSAAFSPQYFRHHHHNNRYWFFFLMTLGATLGVFLSDDFYTTLIFFEIMSLTSYTWVAQEETPGAMRAGATYLAVAVIGGLTTLMGLFLLWKELGTLSFAGVKAALEGQQPSARVTVAAWLTLFGFAAKAGMFPLHIWLPKAHPVAPAPASALLSGILTKSGLFGVIVITANIFPGSAAFGIPLLVLGGITMLLGAVMALFSIDLKKTLACSSVSQIGFITVGIACMTLLGEEGSLAAYGAVEHMINHSLIKLCLFLCAGVVYMNLHRLDLNEIRGFGRNKPVLHAAFLIGALSIGCVPPLGSGFNSKSLLHEGILEYMHHLQHTGAAWWPVKLFELMFLFSGGLTVAYMTKLYVCLFWEKNRDAKLQECYDSMRRGYLSWPTAIALILTAVPLPLLGLFGSRLLSPLAERAMPFFGQEALAEIHYFSAENLIGAAESIAIGAAVYLLVVRPLLMRREGKSSVYVNLWPEWLDMENKVYRPLLDGLVAASYAVVRRIEHLPDCRLVRQWIPHSVAAATAWCADIPDMPLFRQWLPAAITAVTRFFGEIPERLTWLVRKTLLRAKRPPKTIPVGNKLTWYVGRTADTVAQGLNRSLTKKHPLRTDYEYVLDAQHQANRRTTDRISHSVSWNLLLLAAGLVVMAVYLLLRSEV